jgi:hypothetical protein
LLTSLVMLNLTKEVNSCQIHSPSA